jgi:hypothetical protein
VRHGAVAAQIAIPPIRLRIETELSEPAIEMLETFFAL